MRRGALPLSNAARGTGRTPLGHAANTESPARTPNYVSTPRVHVKCDIFCEPLMDLMSQQIRPECSSDVA